MAIAFVTHNATAGNGTTLSTTVPGSTNDILIAALSWTLSRTMSTPAADWTQMALYGGINDSGAMYYKVHDGAEPAPSWVLNGTTDWGIFIAAFSGAVAPTVAVTTVIHDAIAAWPTPSITTVADNSMVIRSAHNRSTVVMGAWAASTEMQEIANGQIDHTMAYKAQVSTGASGTENITPAAWAQGRSMVCCLEPAAAGGGSGSPISGPLGGPIGGPLGG